MADILPFKRGKRAKPTPTMFKPIPPGEFDFDEELANLIGIVQELPDANNVGQVKKILSEAIEHVMTWPDG